MSEPERTWDEVQQAVREHGITLNPAPDFSTSGAHLLSTWPDPDPAVEPFPGAGGRTILGYRTMPKADQCSFCGDRYYAVQDDGQPDTWLVRCWCGARARVRKDDPDLLEEIRAALPQ